MSNSFKKENLMKLKSAFMAIITLLVLASCATSPLGRTQMMMLPDNQMNAMGVKSFATYKQKLPIEKDSTINRYVRCVADAILTAANLPANQWEVVVFRDNSANAFAVPGNKIGVHTGLLDISENQSQLATVMGHEVSHVLAKHGNERASQSFALEQGLGIAQQVFLGGNSNSGTNQTIMGVLGLGAQFGVMLPFSRIHESEADEHGLYLMSAAGFDPRESVRLWQNMSKDGGKTPEFLSTHPSGQTRITRLNQAMPKAMRNYNQAQASGRKPRCG
jgi:predicted Zn-dependent protease